MILLRFTYLFPVFLFFCVLFFAVGPFAASAQFDVGGEPEFSVSPAHPSPNSAVTLRINAYDIGTRNASIRWFIDGEELVEEENERSISVTVGDLGEQTTVRADVLDGRSSFSVSKTLTPIEIDIIIEAFTTTPAFYDGRPLPTPGAPLRVVAVPHTGTGADVNALSYRWELDGDALFGGAVQGKQSAAILAPQLGRPYLSVTVFDTSGQKIGKKTVALQTTQPELYFYKENPLRSTNRKAITETLPLTTEEITVRAEPYFVNPDVFGENWEYGWRLNNSEVESNNDDPRLVTLRQTGGAGNATLGFKVVNTRSLLQSVQGSFNISFSGNRDQN